jgi:hypothetical protein
MGPTVVCYLDVAERKAEALRARATLATTEAGESLDPARVKQLADEILGGVRQAKQAATQGARLLRFAVCDAADSLAPRSAPGPEGMLSEMPVSTSTCNGRPKVCEQAKRPG